MGGSLFAVALVGRIVFAFLLVSVMQLFEDFHQLVRDGQADVGRVLQQTQALVSSLMVNF